MSSKDKEAKSPTFVLCKHGQYSDSQPLTPCLDCKDLVGLTSLSHIWSLPRTLFSTGVQGVVDCTRQHVQHVMFLYPCVNMEFEVVFWETFLCIGICTSNVLSIWLATFPNHCVPGSSVCFCGWLKTITFEGLITPSFALSWKTSAPAFCFHVQQWQH